jgi:hypothetical protein
VRDLLGKRGVLLWCIERERFGRGESWVLMVKRDDGAPEE